MAKKREKEKFVRSKQHSNIGTIGHVDHGKTTLTAAITYALSLKGLGTYQNYEAIDKTPEERRRKITIKTSHVEYETEKRHYSHIDCPGHQDYIKNMITGASQMEGAILVVSAPDGIQVQTREHIILAKEIGLEFLVVFINKIDRILDEEMVGLLELEIIELLLKYGFGEKTEVPIVQGSALKALNGEKKYLENIYELMDIIDEQLPEPKRLLDEPFLMPIESVLVAQGRGTVVTGKVERGVLRENMDLDLVSKKIYKTTCMGIEMYHKILDEAQAGDNIGVLLKNVPNKEISRGDVLALPDSVEKKKYFKARVYILTAEEGGRKTAFYSGYRPQFFFRVNNVSGSIRLSEGVEMVMPGDNVIIDVELGTAVVLNPGLRFIIREGKLTIGAGLILETS